MRCWACSTLGGKIVGQDCNNNGMPDNECESFPKGACCTITSPPPQVVCTAQVSEACCNAQNGEWHGSGSKCSEVDCFAGPYFVQPGGGE